MGMGHSRRMTWSLAACGAVLIATACNAKGGREDYSNAADSGAAAPATRLDTSMTRDRPDSTTGGPDRTGKRGVSVTSAAGNGGSAARRPVSSAELPPETAPA